MIMVTLAVLPVETHQEILESRAQRKSGRSKHLVGLHLATGGSSRQSRPLFQVLPSLIAQERDGRLPRLARPMHTLHLIHKGFDDFLRGPARALARCKRDTQSAEQGSPTKPSLFAKTPLSSASSGSRALPRLGRRTESLGQQALHSSPSTYVHFTLSIGLALSLLRSARTRKSFSIAPRAAWSHALPFLGPSLSQALSRWHDPPAS